MKNEFITGKTVLKSVGEIHHEEQMAYFESVLHPIGLDMETIYDYTSGIYLNKDASELLKAVECFFFTINEFVNYFITQYTHPKLDIKSRSIVSDGSQNGEFLSLHYLNPKRTPNVVSFDFTTMASSGMFKVEDFTTEKDWDNRRYILFGKLYEPDNDLDAYIFEAIKRYVPEWKEMMKSIGKLSR